MLKIYANADGEIIRVLQSYHEEAMYGPPPDYAEMIELDGETNSHVKAILNGDLGGQGGLRLKDGVLTHRGKVLSQREDGVSYSVKRRISDILATLQSGGTLTEAQRDQALAFCLQHITADLRRRL